MRRRHAAVLLTSAVVLTVPASGVLALAHTATPAQQEVRPVDHSAHGQTPRAAAPGSRPAPADVRTAARRTRERLEAARQTNDPAKLRAAIDDALLAMSVLVTAEPCATAAPPQREGLDVPLPAATVFATDPAALSCDPAIEPDAAPMTTYKGNPYYFCTAAERLRFITNPERYLREAGK